MPDVPEEMVADAVKYSLAAFLVVVLLLLFLMAVTAL
jgi:hypothetical protein